MHFGICLLNNDFAFVANCKRRLQGCNFSLICRFQIEWLQQEALTVGVSIAVKPKNVGDLAKLIVAKDFKELPKVQKIAQSGHTGLQLHMYGLNCYTTC